ncbi:M949_RS01915 family surface polysaccharide biosynthesis protein [Chitinophaga rhizophila]|uniref:Uncharacterized protein n=1 Tax=Chitinophaga rhizophila TaxID=2866212 RepID=A0ABS7GCZ7_9BACT|nr:hypothetical protein [Chitinophaga rhizophila]MBW8685296.1 hypothetical protein [Chitinophaga rhizophila]
MRMFLIALSIIITGGKQLYAQQSDTWSKILAPAQTQQTFSSKLHTSLFDNLGIQRAYHFGDASGKYYLVLCESRNEIKEGDTINHKIKAFLLHDKGNGTPEKFAELNDFINSHDRQNGAETSIWFWTKFCELEDLDKDGHIDPLIVYGTKGINGLDDGRIKIMLYHNKQKIAIRIQNGILDDERNIRIDDAFYKLPIPAQQHIRQLMHTLSEKDLVIYPTGYEKAMDKKQLQID